MINNKYIVLFMIGIFLALGLGITIGITLENQNIIENQQNQLIHEIEDHFVSLRTETEQMKLELDSLEEQKVQLQDLSSILLMELIKDKLTGINVSLISFSKQAPISELMDFLNLAGVSIQSSVTLFSDNSALNNENIAYTVQQPDEFITTIIQDLVYSLQHGNITPLVQEAMDLMMISNTGRFDPVDYIILIRQEISTIGYDNILVQCSIETGLPIIVVDSGEIDNNSLLKYRSLGVSTVNQIESICGKLALASILSGYKGNFDFSKNGVDILPSPLFFKKLHDEKDVSNIVFEGEIQ